MAYFVCIALAAGILAAWTGALLSDQSTPAGLHVSYALGILTAVLSAGIVRKSRREYLAELAELDQSIEAVRTDAIGGERGQLLLREMMEDVGVGWYRMSVDGQLEAANLALAVMLGFESVDALRSVCRGNEFAGSTDRTAALSALQTLGEIRNHPASWPTSHGRPTRLLESARAVREEGGRIVHLEGVAVMATQFETGKAKRPEPRSEPRPEPKPEPRRESRSEPRHEPEFVAEVEEPVLPASFDEDPEGNVVDLREVLEDMLEASVANAGARGLEIGFRFSDESAGWVRADGDRLREALGRLMDLAVDHTTAGGVTVHCSLSRSDDDFHNAVFEFRCTDGSAEGLEQLVRGDDPAVRLIGQLGGKVRLDRAAGGGFSLRASVVVDPADGSDSGSADDLLGITVLLVDDNELSSAFLAHQVQSTRAGVLIADRPAEAARVVESDSSVDVIVASLSSARGAAEVVGHLKKIDASRRPPLVLVVPADLRERSSGGRSGSRLGKPVRRSELIRAVLDALPDRAESAVAAEAPKAVSVAAEPAHETAEVPERRDGSLSILVAEDDPVNGRLMLYLLEGMGHRVELVRTGDQAVTAFKERDFDAAIMDVRMPGLSGPDAARRILRNASSRGISPVLLGMTASTASWDRDACLSAGMHACLVKPLTTETIAQALRAAPRASDSVKRQDRPSVPSPRVRPASDTVSKGSPVPVSSAESMEDIRAFLESHHADEPAYAAELVAGFLESAPDLVSAIGNARAAGDTSALREAAHQLRTSCREIGFARLSALCRTLEGAASGDVASEEIDSWTDAVLETFDAVRSALDAEQAELTHLATLQSAN